MILSEEKPDNKYQIQSVTPDRIKISGSFYNSSLIVGADVLQTDWQPYDIKPILEIAPELVLFGTGNHFKLPDQKLLLPLIEANITYECMSTLSAARTLIALVSEGRDVIAALKIGN